MQISLNKNSPTQRDIFTRYFLLLLVLAFYYLSYRYPFKINSSTTSPTYADTPPLLQWGKYIAFLAITGFYTVRYFNPLQRISRMELWLALGWISTMIITAMIVLLAKGNIYLFEISIFYLAMLTVIFSPAIDINYERVYKMLWWFVILSYLANILQLSLYFSTGRLPALAYANSIFVRFGSIWDDPNGFALYQAFVLPFILASPIRALYKFVLVFLGGLTLLLSQSLSGVAGSLAGITVAIIACYGHQPMRIVKWVLLAAIAVLVIMLMIGIEHVFDTYDIWASMKAGSIERRGNFLTDLFNFPALTYLGLNPSYAISENGYAFLLSNLGVFPVLVFFSSLIYCAYAMLRARHAFTDNPSIVAIAVGTLGHTVGYGVANLGVPSIVVFPNNLLFVITLCMAITLHRAVRKAWKEAHMPHIYSL